MAALLRALSSRGRSPWHEGGGGGAQLAFNAVTDPGSPSPWVNVPPLPVLHHESSWGPRTCLFRMYATSPAQTIGPATDGASTGAALALGALAGALAGALVSRRKTRAIAEVGASLPDLVPGEIATETHPGPYRSTAEGTPPERRRRRPGTLLQNPYDLMIGRTFCR